MGFSLVKRGKLRKALIAIDHKKNRMEGTVIQNCKLDKFN